MDQTHYDTPASSDDQATAFSLPDSPRQTSTPIATAPSAEPQARLSSAPVASGVSGTLETTMIAGMKRHVEGEYAYSLINGKFPRYAGEVSSSMLARGDAETRTDVSNRTVFHP